MTKIALIAAIGKNGELGKDNRLLWHIPEDLKRFKKLTHGHAVIMGRKTFESMGRVLSNRINIVVTRDIERFTNHNNQRSKIKKNLELGICCLEFDKNLFICSSLENALQKAKSIEKKEIFVIGGGQIYEQALPYADKLYLTIVDATADADTFFPDYSAFKKILFQEKLQTEKYKLTFLELEQ